MSILTAGLVAVLLYALVMDRDRLMSFARDTAPTALAEDPSPVDATPPAAETAVVPPAPVSGDAPLPEGAVRVMARRSVAQVVDSAVILRGETRAMREVEVRAETSGKVVSEPLRKGVMVEAGQLLCQIDPGTRDASLQEALARLAEAQARLPEAAARLAEARAQVPAARARILEAEAAVPAAEARLAEAQAGVPAAEARLAEAKSRIPEAEARLAEATARVPEAEARLAEAEARVPEAAARLKEAEAAVPAARAALIEAEARTPEAEARVREAEARVREAEINLTAAQSLARDGFAAQTRLAAAEATFEAAKAQAQSAQLGLKSAAAGIEAAKSRVQGALAGVETAKSGIINAEAGVKSAKSQLESAKAGIQAAESQIQNALAGVQSAESQIQGAKTAVASALSGVEGAKAAVILAKSQLEGALAGVQTAMTGEESARSAIQSAEASVAVAEKEIERLKIHAPFAGLLETDTAELGALMQPGAACATVIQLNPIKLIGYVPETEVARVEVGARAGARLTNGKEVVGVVSFVSRSADPATRTFSVELTVDNADLAIRDGETAEIAIEADGAKAHLLASSTLTLNDEGRLGVRTVTENSSAKWMNVAILRDTRDGVWVTGLPDTVDVITVGQEFVTNGVIVVPSYEDTIQ
ncbi:efflux RND transporter periplasmic adaptor subunit [Maliponia aquimaris]|nr:efflux RND transporter periplasmic adaptor subunit [Maliponia aquimaris]